MLTAARHPPLPQAPGWSLLLHAPTARPATASLQPVGIMRAATRSCLALPCAGQLWPLVMSR